MPIMQFVNGNVTTTSTNTRISTDVTLSPASTTGFPTNPQFTILERQTGEIMLVTAVNAGPTWTVTRGFGGTTAQSIGNGDNFDYSITREMLLAGVMVKVDEQNIATDTANGTITVNVPTGLAFYRNLEVRFQGGGSSGNGFLQWRINSDSSNSYQSNYVYGGSGTGSGNAGTSPFPTFGRAWMGNPNAALPALGCDLVLRFSGADSTDRWKTWTGQQFLRQTGADEYAMTHSGRWFPSVQAAITSITFACDNNTNGTWAAGTVRAGTRVNLYLVP